MKRSSALLALPLLVATVLAACGSDDDATPSDSVAETTAGTGGTVTDTDLQLDGRTFESTTVDGQTLVEGSVVQLSFADSSLSINAGCNTIAGGYTLDGSTLQASALAMTMMACDQALMDQDAWLSETFTSNPTLALEGDQLTVTGTNGTTITFTEVAAAEDAPLEGTRWVVDGLLANEGVSTVPIGATAAITINAGTAAVEAGCNTGSAPAEITDTTITFGPMVLTRMMCPDEQMTLENAVTSVLNGEVDYLVEGGTLQLRTTTDTGEIGLNLVAS